jgi:hypothetical protein
MTLQEQLNQINLKLDAILARLNVLEQAANNGMSPARYLANQAWAEAQKAISQTGTV